MKAQEMMDLQDLIMRLMNTLLGDAVSLASTGNLPERYHSRSEHLGVLEAKYTKYRPFFHPMNCMHCRHKKCNRKRENGVCDEYEVIIEER